MNKLIFKGSGTQNTGNRFKFKQPPLISNSSNTGKNNTVTTPFTLTLGSNNVVSGGYQNIGSGIIAGHANSVHSANHSFIIGSNNIVHADYSTINGVQNNVAGNYHSITGQSNLIAQDTNNCSINGNSNTINSNAIFIAVNGSNNIIGSASYCQVFGNNNTVPDNLTNVTIIGNNITATQSHSYIVMTQSQQQNQK